MACRTFEPDHNGECLNCDDWFGSHTIIPEWYLACREATHAFGILHRPTESIAFCLTCGNVEVIYGEEETHRQPAQTQTR